MFLKKIQTIKKPGNLRGEGNLIGFNPPISKHETQVLFEHRKHLPIC